MSADVNSLEEPLRSSVIGLISESGGKVRVDSARRTSGEQIALRRQNCGQTDYDIWQKPSGECHPETAIPGQSKHERGLAVDLAGDLTLAGKLAPKYALVRTVASEPWHFEHQSTAGVQDGGSGEGPKKTTTGAGNVWWAITNPGGAAKAIAGAGGAVADAVLPDYLTDLPKAGLEFLKRLLDPLTWARVVGVLAGGALVTIGFSLIAQDLTGISAVGVARTVSNPAGAGASAAASSAPKSAPAKAVKAATKTTPAKAAGAANPATPLT